MGHRDVKEYSIATEHIVKLYVQWVINEGHMFASKRLKAYYGQALRYSVSHKLEPLPFTRCFSDGLPVQLGPIAKLLRGDIWDKRTALFLLSIYKLHVAEVKEVASSSITNPGLLGFTTDSRKESLSQSDYFTMISHSQEFSDEERDLILLFRREFFRTLKEMFPKNERRARLQRIQDKSRIHLSSRNGPNGQAVISAPLDFLAIQDTPLKESIYYMAEKTKNLELKQVLEMFENCELEAKAKDGKRSLLTSRLSIKSESGGKGRLFAIIDYFTQSSMTGLHSYLYEYLNTLEEDATESHDKAVEGVRLWSKEGRWIESIDLSKATDRFPAIVQGYVISAIVDDTFADHWLNLMTNRDFELNGEYFRFKVGQPLGALSSWACFALTHHIVVRTCKRILRQSRQKADYFIIGDDLALTGSKLGDLYRFISTRLLGVEISETKGFSPRTYVQGMNPSVTSRSPSVVEIAKRVIIEGEEVTPISPVLALDGLENPFHFPDLLREIERRVKEPHQLETPAAAIASFSFKPKWAMTHATFPLSPAPLTQVTVDKWYEQGKTLYPELTWFNQGIKATWMLEFYSLDELRKVVSVERTESTEAYNNLIQEVVDNGGSVGLSHWLYTSPNSTSFLDLIWKRCNLRIDSYLQGNALNGLTLNRKDPISGEMVAQCPNRLFLLTEKGFGLRSILKEYLGLKELIDLVTYLFNKSTAHPDRDKTRVMVTGTYVRAIARRLQGGK
jgi:hypothetical protein